MKWSINIFLTEEKKNPLSFRVYLLFIKLYAVLSVPNTNLILPISDIMIHHLIKWKQLTGHGHPDYEVTSFPAQRGHHLNTSSKGACADNAVIYIGVYKNKDYLDLGRGCCGLERPEDATPC